MTAHVIWALCVAFCAVAAWDMVRRWSFATATRSLKAQFEDLRAEIGAADLRKRVNALENESIRWKEHYGTTTGALRTDLDALRGEFGDAKLPARLKQLETVVIALKTHAETQRAARPNPFLRKAGG